MKFFILVLAIIAMNSQLLFGQVYLPTQNSSGNENVGIGGRSPDSKLQIYVPHKPFGPIASTVTNPNFVGLKITQRQNNDPVPLNIPFYPTRNIIEVNREIGISNQMGATTVNVLTLDNAGRLGLGINLPTERLDIYGNARISGKLLTGNIGIGLITPAAHLHISVDDPTIILDDNVSAPGSPDKGWFKIGEHNGAGRLISDKGLIMFLDADNTDEDEKDNNQFQIVSNSSFWNTDTKVNFRVRGNGDAEIFGKLKFGAWELFQTVDNNNAYFRLNRGTQKLLAVDSQGKLYATAVKVTVTEFPDFVFDSTYQLMPLRDLELFIAKNHHLPDVPSEKEVKADGLDLGEMNKILLQKIEELTLHLIQQEKRISELENKGKNEK